MATTRYSSANLAATWVHQWAWAPPPCTNTSPRRPASPQATKWIGQPSTSTKPSVHGTASARVNQLGAARSVGSAVPPCAGTVPWYGQYVPPPPQRCHG